MADYNNLRERVDLYVKMTGLPRASVNDFRKTATNKWTTARDRRIGRAIRGLERLWRDPELTVKLWLRFARGVLRAIHDFLADVITTVEQLGERLATAIDRALLWAERTADRVEAFLDRHPWLRAVFRLIASAGSVILGVRAARRLPARG